MSAKRTLQDYRFIKVYPKSGALGAHVDGVNLANLDQPTFDEIYRAFAEYSVLYFKNQKLRPEDQVAFSARFGDLTRHPLIEMLQGHPYVAVVKREVGAQGLAFGGVWHADASFMEAPGQATTLYAIDVPPYGGDTMFSNLYMAYETLSPTMQALCDQLIAVHSTGILYAPQGKDDDWRSSLKEKSNPKTTETEHPLVCVHGVTGRKLLYMTGPYCTRFKGMTEAESKPILDFLYQHIQNPNFTCRFSYEPGTLAIWDNRAVLHFAVCDYPDFRRELHRVQVEGPPPVGPAMPVRAGHQAAA